jgi:uncharacterized protein
MRHPILYGVLLIFILACSLVMIFRPDKSSEHDLAVQDEQAMEQFESTLENRMSVDLSNPKAMDIWLKEQPVATLVFFAASGFVLLLSPLGFFLLLAYLYAQRRDREWIKPVQTIPLASWSVSDIFRISICFTASIFLLMIVEAQLVHIGILSKDAYAHRLSVVNATLMDIGIGFLILMFARRGTFSETLRGLGLLKRGIQRNIPLGFLGYLCILPVFGLLLAGIVMVSRKIGYEPPTHPLVTIFVADNTLVTQVVSIVLGVLVGPFMEEVFFRGFCYSALRRRFGVWTGIVISSLFFSVVHWNPFSALPIFCLGVGLAYLYEKTGSLTASIVMHSLHNTLLILFLFAMKGVVAT